MNVCMYVCMYVYIRMYATSHKYVEKCDWNFYGCDFWMAFTSRTILIVRVCVCCTMYVWENVVCSNKDDRDTIDSTVQFVFVYVYGVAFFLFVFHHQL